MAIKQEVCTNPKVVAAVEELMNGMPAPITHGEFNRRMFLETIVAKGGSGISMDKESLMSYACIPEREFEAIKDEYLAQGIIKEETNPIVGEPLYSLQLTAKEEAI